MKSELGYQIVMLVVFFGPFVLAGALGWYRVSKPDPSGLAERAVAALEKLAR